MRLTSPSGSYFFPIAFFSLFGCTSAGNASREAADSSAAASGQYTDYSTDELDSYGEWINLPPYGTVWKPNVTTDWTPFYYGHWDYTGPDWTWVSYEPFGWIVYHYGNWFYTPDYGWVWVPDNAPWSPAVVEWMYYDDFVCWAPLPPRGIAWPRPWERFENRVDVWTVVRARDFMSENLGAHRLESSPARPDGNVRIVNRFPDPNMIEQRTGQPVRTVRMDRVPVRVGKQQLNRLQLGQPDQQRVERYRPQVESRVQRRTGRHR